MVSVIWVWWVENTGLESLTVAIVFEAFQRVVWELDPGLPSTRVGPKRVAFAHALQVIGGLLKTRGGTFKKMPSVAAFSFFLPRRKLTFDFSTTILLLQYLAFLFAT